MDFNFDIIGGYLPLFLRGTLYTVGFSIARSSLVPFLTGHRLRQNAEKSALALAFPGLHQFLPGHAAVCPDPDCAFRGGSNPFGSTNALISGVVALSLNSAAYTAEIFRAGIQSVDPGQREAALSLGMTGRQSMRFVVLPQAVKRMVPAFGNEFIVLVKDSSLLALVAAPEIMYWSNTMKGQYMRIWEPYLTAAVIYFVLTYSLSKLLSYIERRI